MDRTAGWHRPMLRFAGFMAVCSVGCVIGLVVDDRVLLGAPIWMKPLKFAISMALYCVTWSWMHGLLTRGRRTAYWVGNGILACMVVESVVIVGQVARGRPSHFNNSTPLDATLWSVMAVTIVTLWVGTLVLTALVMRAPIADPASRWAVRLGAAISLVGLGLGALMTTPPRAQPHRVGEFDRMIGAHSVGVSDGGPGMPLTGWSTTGGDLRIPHFVGMHALQALPLLVMLLGVLATRVARLRPLEVRAKLVIIAASGYAGLVALVTWQALRGQPLIHPDTYTATAAIALALAVLGATGLVFGRPATEDQARDDARAEVSA
ncbi:hypothetical protein [Pseudonocardia spinosispora]|uniref:hypothetical protein n=1 Tax=Pseudonocardia spinosispora TaxID=103441 RepID=UPI000687A380|nr:hypothetical protein [Pseudonocardia spinosispora]